MKLIKGRREEETRLKIAVHKAWGIRGKNERGRGLSNENITNENESEEGERNKRKSYMKTRRI